MNFETILHSIYYRIPFISHENKRKLILFIHKNFAFLTKKSLSYKLNIDTNHSSDHSKSFDIIPYDPSDTSIKFHSCKKPLISIIIPFFNKIEYTWRCLKSIDIAGSQYPFEIIIIDDCSQDNTHEVLNQIQGIRIIHNKNNIGFIRSCNKGAMNAKGSYLVFLNNDTQVLAGWLDELMHTFKARHDAGIVGAKLIYPNGKLQEAGGVIFQDGLGLNYGKHDDPLKPEYNYLREVDYCSGACIMISSQLFNQLGLFDERYISGYYEDTDLAFSVRKIGKKVLYQPMSRVIHFEGITSGTDIHQGVKVHQISNGKKFYRKWAHVLKNHIRLENFDINTKDQYTSKRLLFIDATTPQPDMDSGSIDTFNYLQILQALSFQVTFVPLSNFLYIKPYTTNLQKMGIECLYTPYINNLIDHFNFTHRQYDVVVISRVTEAIKSIDVIKKYCKNAKIIFNPVDIHFLRIQRQGRLFRSNELIQNALKLKKMELFIAQYSDCTIVLSDKEKNILLKENNKLNIEVLPFVSTCLPDGKNFKDRDGILFIGNFQHPPNCDAILYFLDKIWPIVQLKNPNTQFYIIGPNPVKQLTKKCRKNVHVKGHVKDLSIYFNQCKLSVAPLRYGAGIKGKIRTSLSYGLPIVATSIAVEGMGLKNDTNVLIADNETEFANSIIELCSNQDLWEKLKTNGKKFVEINYSMDRCRKKFINIFRSFNF
ncbi:glycosyltransferase [Candidatus Magnetomorum sp. HK-1]|nr:glycosyltransferase [Candidatus Magnetomorum sp. HK-1]